MGNIADSLNSYWNNVSKLIEAHTTPNREKSATASKAYAVGDYLVYNDLLYRVTAAIASGGTITVGTNVTAVNVGTELSAKQNALTFDTTPTANSANPVTSGGVQSAMAALSQEVAQELAKRPEALMSDVTYYVDSTNGSDSNDGLSSAAALKTIMAAVNKIPKDMGGHSVAINVAAGTYNEDLYIWGFHNGHSHQAEASIVIEGVLPGTHINGGVKIWNNAAGIYLHLFELSRSSNVWYGIIDIRGNSGSITLNNVFVYGNNNTIGFFFGWNATQVALYQARAFNCAYGCALAHGILLARSLNAEGCNVGLYVGSANSGTTALAVLSEPFLYGMPTTKYAKEEYAIIFDQGALV